MLDPREASPGATEEVERREERWQCLSFTLDSVCVCLRNLPSPDRKHNFVKVHHVTQQHLLPVGF